MADLTNLRRLARNLGDQGFVDAVSRIDEIVEEVDETMDRVKKLEGETSETLDRVEEMEREANDLMFEVEERLVEVEKTLQMIRATMEGGFTVIFYYFAVTHLLSGGYLVGIPMLILGILGSGSLAFTILHLPQIRRLRNVLRHVT